MRTIKFLYSVTLVVIISHNVYAARVDTVVIKSTVMQKSPKAVVVIPDVYFNSDTLRIPVLYLLHGWSGKYSDWSQKTDLKPLADKYGFIFVCPDGGYAGWYLDSPLASSSRYFTYLTEEVVGFVDDNYRTIDQKNGRVVCGLSMGGHGAISMLAKRPDLFCAAGSMSGVMELNESSKKYGIVQLLGEYDQNEHVWLEHSCIHLVERLAGLNKGILIDCGIEDRFIDVNRKLHAKLLKLKIKHDYHERPGGHSWVYWTNALEYHLLYFKKRMEI